MLAARVAPAQTPPPPFFTLGDARVDSAVPESPAFSALGVTPDRISRPTSARDLATSLLNGVDRAGNEPPDPCGRRCRAVNAADRTGHHARGLPAARQYLTRFLARWQMSFASTKGGGQDDPSARIALGMRVTFFDRGDPMASELSVVSAFNGGLGER